jgi:AcrR family transcriptional regulator
MVDPRVTRTEQAVEKAVLALAADRSVSQITVSELAAASGVTRATIYNRYATPLDALIRALHRDLLAMQAQDELRRKRREQTAQEALRLATADIVSHVERHREIYQRAIADPADRGVYDALIEHFTSYTLAFMGTAPKAPKVANPRIVARYLSYGFAGAIKEWLTCDQLSSDELVEAVTAAAPGWWI